MLLVFGISRTALYIIQLHQVQNAVLSYHISLVAGFLGLALFVALLYLTVGNRLNKISKAVDCVSNGQLETVIDIGGKDEIAQLADNFNRMTKGLKAKSILAVSLCAMCRTSSKRLLVQSKAMHNCWLRATLQTPNVHSTLILLSIRQSISTS